MVAVDILLRHRGTTMTDELMRLRSEDIVVAMVGKDNAFRWWHSANKAFDGKTPEQQWMCNPRVVYQYLMNNLEGEW